MRCLHSRKAANTAFRQQPHAASRLLDCAPLFESETSVCTLVPANPEYYAGGSTAGRTEGPTHRTLRKAEPGALSETEKFSQRRSAPRTARRGEMHAHRTKRLY